MTILFGFIVTLKSYIQGRYQNDPSQVPSSPSGRLCSFTEPNDFPPARPSVVHLPSLSHSSEWKKMWFWPNGNETVKCQPLARTDQSGKSTLTDIVKN